MTKEKFNERLGQINDESLEVRGSAFDEIYKFLLPKIIRHISIKYNDKELAKDIAHDFFIKLRKQILHI